MFMVILFLGGVVRMFGVFSRRVNVCRLWLIVFFESLVFE